MPVINVVPTLKKLFIKERRYQKYSRRTETHKERERKRMVANLSCMKLKKNVGNRQKSFSMSINVTKLRMEEKLQLGCTSGETFLCVGSFSFLAN
jgi:hypothetical protein